MAPGLLIESGGSEPRRSLKDERFSGFEHLQSWPKNLQSDLAWDASSFNSEDDYTLTLTQQDRAEIEIALNFFKSGRPA